MGSGEKKVAALLAVVLVALVAVYFTQKGKPQAQGWPGMAGGAGQFGGLQEFGEPGAAVEITALVPVVNPCHANTLAALKEAYDAHPDDIHMTVIDFFGAHAGGWKQKLGVTCATITINGEKTFEVGGRTVTFHQVEGGSYKPEDLRPAIEAELAKVKAAG
jgi:hypothetical protein